jgi:hypothetical protein
MKLAARSQQKRAVTRGTVIARFSGMGSFRSLALWKGANHTQCVLVPLDLCGSYDVRLFRHDTLVKSEQVADMDTAYHVATAWQHEQQAASTPIVARPPKAA